MRLDLGRTWSDAGAMIRANFDMVSAIMGMFVLLPGLLTSWILPDRVPPKEKMTLVELLKANSDYMSAHWPFLLSDALLVAFGSLAMIALLLHPTRPTVADALRLALFALPFYLLASLIQTVAVMTGVFFLILPGIYLAARFLCIPPVAMVEQGLGPLAIVARSFQITRGNGLRIILLLVIVLFVATIISTVISLIAGIAAVLLLPPDLARLVVLLVGATFRAALTAVIVLMSASIYRQLNDGTANSGLRQDG